MHPRIFALLGGILMLALGILSLIPPLVGPMQSLPNLDLDVSYGLFAGLFPMNIINKIVLILFGAAGVASALSAYTALPRSIKFWRVVFFVMAAAAILGIFPATQTFFGYWPLFGGEVLLHGLFALAGVYFGYSLSAKVPDSGPAVKSFTTPLSRTR